MRQLVTLGRLLRINGLSGTIRRLQLHFGRRRFSPGDCRLQASQPNAATVVYTAVVGDTLPPQPNESPIPHVCFTDNARLHIAGWEIRLIDPGDCPRRTARRIKILGPGLIPGYDSWIWHDAKQTLNADPAILLSVSEQPVVAFDHPERNCTYREARAVSWLRLDSEETIRKQVKRYRSAGLPTDFGLLETAILIRRRSPAVEHFNELWWHEVDKGCVRDQLSVMFALWKSGIRWGTLAGCREDNPYGELIRGHETPGL